MNSRRYRVKCAPATLISCRQRRGTMARTVKVHDDTHAALKQLKAQRRARSVDEVIREMVRQTTGQPVERLTARKGSEITAFLQ